MNIILIGLPRAGKTTHGKQLAHQLGWTFVDTDDMIEKSFGKKKSYREIFREEGETFFRSLEKEQIASLQGVEHHVIATGGGACAPENIEVLQSLGCIVYLKIDPEIVWERMCKKGFLSSIQCRDDFDTLVKTRIPLYEKAADLVKELVEDGE